MSRLGERVTLRQLKTRLLYSYADCPESIAVWSMGKPETWVRVGEAAGERSIYERTK